MRHPHRAVSGCVSNPHFGGTPTRTTTIRRRCHVTVIAYQWGERTQASREGYRHRGRVQRRRTPHSPPPLFPTQSRMPSPLLLMHPPLSLPTSVHPHIMLYQCGRVYFSNPRIRAVSLRLKNDLPSLLPPPPPRLHMQFGFHRRGDGFGSDNAAALCPPRRPSARRRLGLVRSAQHFRRPKRQRCHRRDHLIGPSGALPWPGEECGAATST